MVTESLVLYYGEAKVKWTINETNPLVKYNYSLPIFGQFFVAVALLECGYIFLVIIYRKCPIQ